MSDIRELYQEVIIDHGRHPRNFGELPSCNHSKEGFNPLCGDKITVYLDIQDGVVKCERRVTGDAAAKGKQDIPIAARKGGKRRCPRYGTTQDLQEIIFVAFRQICYGVKASAY